MPDKLLIVLHGVGAQGSDLAPLGEVLADALPDCAYAAPDAPSPFDGPFGFRQWYSHDGITDDNRADRIVAARADFDAVIADVLDQHAFSERLDRIAFVGFSQGTNMALDAVASGRWKVRGLVGFSGRLSTPDPICVDPALPILIVHGEDDTAVPASECVSANRRLCEAGSNIRHVVEPDVGHEVSGNGHRLAIDFLRGVFAVDEPVA